MKCLWAAYCGLFYEALKSMHVVEMLIMCVSCYVARSTRLGSCSVCERRTR